VLERAAQRAAETTTTGVVPAALPSSSAAMGAPNAASSAPGGVAPAPASLASAPAATNPKKP